MKEYKDWEDFCTTLLYTFYVACRNQLKSKIKMEDFKKSVPFTLEDLIQKIPQIIDPSWMTLDNYGKFNKKSYQDTDSSTWTWQIVKK